MGMLKARWWWLLLLLSLCPARAAVLDESPAVEGEWGYRPAAGSVSEVTPPGFSWRPTKGIATYEVEVGRGDGFGAVEYRAEGIAWSVHCPPRVFPAGRYTWHYRGKAADGTLTPWSAPRTFTIAPDAADLPLPARADLLARIPKTHPRLFVRPEELPRLRERARGDLKPQFDALVRQCDKLLASPPPTAEPPKYPEGMVRGSEEWIKIWWGNRTYTIAALDGAATLAFCWLVGGKEEYGQLARRILVECAKWDPKGSTGYRYNDEAGMPFAWGFARAYTFTYDLLTEEERAACRKVMQVRGEEMYRHLCPNHLWHPYASHSNRAWHKLAEVGTAFLGEIPGAGDWVWFGANVFANVYPVWSDDDGGWHEGSSYWQGYLEKFSIFADVMRADWGINPYRKPFFARVGWYPMYLQPPGTRGGGFGDLTPERNATANVRLMTNFAAQAGNGHWEWYAEQVGGPKSEGGYVGFVRGALPAVKPTPPDDLPASRLFRGTGQAYLNTSLKSADENVQVVFKSSPFGTQSHGYEANNAFLLNAFGERLLIQTGRRDTYGSDHHRNWMWSTRSVNSITVDGKGQVSHSAAARGAVVGFKTTPAVDVVVGEAGGAYRNAAGGPLLDRFTRAILFIKPELVVVYDRLAAKEPAAFDYWLHAQNRIETPDQHALQVKAGDVVCDADFLAPAGLTFRQTDQYDPNPRARIKVREWHLAAAPPEKRQKLEYVLACRPRRASSPALPSPTLAPIAGGYVLRARLSDGEVTALLPADDGALLQADGLTSRGAIVVRRTGKAGTSTVTVP